MIFSRPLSAILVSLVLGCHIQQALSQGSELYRYRNKEGNVVVDHRVPPEYVSGGYEVLNENGVVIRVVPRSLTEQERADISARRNLEDAALKEQERLREWDESLLLRYSTVADIEAARDRALRELRIRVSILKSNRRTLRVQVENYQAQAADMERRKQAVDEARLKSIARLQRDIAATERQIAEREREIDEVDASFGRDIERFRMLEEVVKLRGKMAADDLD
jgi:vacuolar-type H+-ATPase subunit I/STV1